MISYQWFAKQKQTMKNLNRRIYLYLIDYSCQLDYSMSEETYVSALLQTDSDKFNNFFLSM